MSRDLVIVGVDPGLTTGLTVLLVQFDVVHLGHGVEVPPEQVRVHVSQLLKRTEHVDAVVGCERFFVLPGTARKTRQSDAQQVIGVVEDEARTAGAEFVLQSAADAKLGTSNTLLKTLGWYTPAANHVNDARRHALLLLKRRRAGAFVELISRGRLLP